jgi:hypothetical protein
MANNKRAMTGHMKSSKKRREFMMGWPGIRFGIVGAPLAAATVALAAVGVPDNIRLANNVVPAPFGYEAVTTQYVVAEPTALYVSPYIYPGAVNKEQLKPGQAVDILAKPKGYDWILVGKDGIGIGYIPISRLTPAKR